MADHHEPRDPPADQGDARPTRSTQRRCSTCCWATTWTGARSIIAEHGTRVSGLMLDLSVDVKGGVNKGQYWHNGTNEKQENDAAASPKLARSQRATSERTRARWCEQPITETLENNYMPYAMSVIVSRALPEIDGFKPAHRKLLYTMYKMGLLKGDRTKSANIVGQHDAPEPPRRRGHLRHDGAPGARPTRALLVPVCGLQGQLRQGVLPRYGLRRRPLYRGEAGADLRRAVPRHRQGYRGFCATTTTARRRSRRCCRSPSRRFWSTTTLGIAVGMASPTSAPSIWRRCARRRSP